MQNEHHQGTCVLQADHLLQNTCRQRPVLFRAYCISIHTSIYFGTVVCEISDIFNLSDHFLTNPSCKELNLFYLLKVIRIVPSM